MNEKMKWYIEQAIREDNKNSDEDTIQYWINKIMNNWEYYPEVLLKALELAVKDVG